MKTAVSISDELFLRAEASAKTWKMSRSRLYATALEEFLDRSVPAEVTAALDKVYSREHAKVDPDLFSAALQSIPKEKW